MLVKSLLPFVLAALAVNAAPVDQKPPSGVPAKPSPPSPVDVVGHVVGGSNKSINKEKYPINLPFGPRDEPEVPEPKKESSPLPVDPSSKLSTVKSHAPRDDDNDDEDGETEAKKSPASKKPSSPLPVDPVSTIKSHAPRDNGKKPAHGSGGAPTDKLPINPVAIVAPRDEAEVYAAKKPAKKSSSPTDKLPVNPIDKVGEVKSHAPRDDGEIAAKKLSKKPTKGNDKAAMPQLPPPQVAQVVSHAPRASKPAPKAASVQLPPAQVKQTVSHLPRDDDEAEVENKRKPKQQPAPSSPAGPVVGTVEKNAPVHRV